MDWKTEELLRKSLPYGVWQWDDHETIFNRDYEGIATKVANQPNPELVMPPHRMKAAQYFYTLSSSPWHRSTWMRVPTERLEKILRDFGVDPQLRQKSVREEITAQKRRELKDRNYRRRVSW